MDKKEEVALAALHNAYKSMRMLEIASGNPVIDRIIEDPDNLYCDALEMLENAMKEILFEQYIVQDGGNLEK